MTFQTFSKTTLKTTLGLSACILLAACQSTGSTASSTKPGATGSSSSIDAALQHAAANASANGETGQSLSYLEKIYKRNSDDPQAALNYASGLRESDYLNQAALVLTPFANDPKGLPAAKTEFAAIQLALGNNKSAEQYAKKAVIQNPADYKAYHYLGIALDAQGMHPEAERAFRKSLENWEGDPTPVMNNLALNLTAQDYLDEAAEILEKAQAIAPNRVEIERNLRIVRTLQQSARHAPKPVKKPSTAAHSAPAKQSADVKKPAVKTEMKSTAPKVNN